MPVIAQRLSPLSKIDRFATGMTGPHPTERVTTWVTVLPQKCQVYHMNDRSTLSRQVYHKIDSHYLYRFTTEGPYPHLSSGKVTDFNNINLIN